MWEVGRKISAFSQTLSLLEIELPEVGRSARTGGCLSAVLQSGQPSLFLPGYSLPWEDPNSQYPENLARPLEVAIEASNGASDYGNKFGEPVLAGKAVGGNGHLVPEVGWGVRPSECWGWGWGWGLTSLRPHSPWCPRFRLRPLLGPPAPRWPAA